MQREQNGRSPGDRRADRGRLSSTALVRRRWFYALAVVAYEWIAGHTPFQGTAVEVVTQHATQPPPSLVAQIPGITQEVEAVLFKALAKDYRERFSSIQEFATALQEASFPPTLRRP